MSNAKLVKFGLVDTRSNKRVLLGYASKSNLLDAYFNEFLLQRGRLLIEQLPIRTKYKRGERITSKDIAPFKIIKYGAFSNEVINSLPQPLETVAKLTNVRGSGQNLKYKVSVPFRRDSSYAPDKYESDKNIRLQISIEHAKGKSAIDTHKQRNKLCLVELVSDLSIKDKKYRQHRNILNRLSLFKVGDKQTLLYDDFIRDIIEELPQIKLLEVVNNNPNNTYNTSYVVDNSVSEIKSRYELHVPISTPQQSKEAMITLHGSISNYITNLKSRTTSIKRIVRTLQALGYSKREAKALV